MLTHIETKFYAENGYSMFYPAPAPHPLHPDIVIPPLRMGSINNLALDYDTVRRSYGPEEEYYGLKEYIRTTLPGADIPLYLVDEHNAAMYGWYEAFNEGRIVKGATIIHFDAHGDEDYPHKRVPFNCEDLNSVAEAAKKIEIYEFIGAAALDELVGEMIWIRPDFRKSQYYRHHGSKGTMPYLSLGVGSLSLDYLLRDVPPESIIVDVDLDIFEEYTERRLGNKNLSPVQLNRLHQTTIDEIRTWMPRAGVITIATSPGFIYQEWAAELAKEILQPFT